MNLIPRGLNLENLFDSILPVSQKGELKCDIYEEDGMYNIEVDTPGFKKEDISIEYEDGYIIIIASKETVKNDESKKYIRREREASEVKREFYLGNVDIDKIKAKFKSGLLSIQIPKKSNIASKKSIEIE